MDSKFMSKVAFTPLTIDAAFVNSLVNLVNACRKNDVMIDEVIHYQHGWLVTFKGYDKSMNAVCHDGSYGNPIHDRYFEEDKYRNDWNEVGYWETIGFPWDYDDVSIHSAEELAEMIHKLNMGINEWNDKEE